MKPEKSTHPAVSLAAGAKKPSAPEGAVARIAQVIGDLPAMPHIAARVLEKLSDEDANPKEINELITKDQALAARVLKVANSPFYGASRSIATLHDAVMFMGFDSIRSLITTAVLKGMYSKVGLAEKLLWEHSVGCGLTAKKIANEIRYRGKEEAYLAGLMHDVGKTALFLHAPEAMREIMEAVYNDGADFFGAEQRMFGFNHAMVGGAIAANWRFTSGIEEAIANHHQPERGGASELAQIVSAANSICHKLEVGPIRRPDLDLNSVKSLKALGLDSDRVELMLVEVKETLQSEPGGI